VFVLMLVGAQGDLSAVAHRADHHQKPHALHDRSHGGWQAAPANRPAPDPPAQSMSVYMRTTRQRVMDGLGCRHGRESRHTHADDGIVVLAFGKPMHRAGQYGASLFGVSFRPVGLIERGVRSYIEGYARCGHRTPGASAVVAVGTSNFGDQVSWAHGQAWARMVNRLNDWLASATPIRGIQVAAAADIEAWWNGPWITRQWVRGYESASRFPYYNFGDAGACPPYGDCAGAWTEEDVWYVSWGSPAAWPLPEVYTSSGSMAKQWYRLSLYSYREHGSAMAIAGVITQKRACRQMPDPCHGIRNTPRQGWLQLWRALNSDRRTAQQLRWATDIGWSQPARPYRAKHHPTRSAQRKHAHRAKDKVSRGRHHPRADGSTPAPGVDTTSGLAPFSTATPLQIS
jgi:hypothetical protein